MEYERILLRLFQLANNGNDIEENHIEADNLILESISESVKEKWCDEKIKNIREAFVNIPKWYA